MQLCRAALLLLLLPSALLLTGAAQERAVGLKPLPTCNDAWLLAAADIDHVPEYDRPYTRYIWIPSGNGDDLQTLSLDINEVLSHSTLIEPNRPVPVLLDTPDRGRVLLGRINLRKLAPQDDRNGPVLLRKLQETWEELVFDPLFSILLTRDSLKFLGEIAVDPNTLVTARLRGKRNVVRTEPYVYTDGKTYNAREEWSAAQTVQVRAGDVNAKRDDIVVARLPGDHIDPGTVQKLYDLTHSYAPVVSFPYFHHRALTTIQDEQVSGGLWQAVWGGLYYRFANIRSGDFKKGTDLDNFIQGQGIGDVETNRDYLTVFNELRSDQKILKFRSDVTKGPRRVNLFRAPAGRFDLSSGIVRITDDLKRANMDIGVHPALNLERSIVDGHEVFGNKSNGFILAAAFDGKGKRLDEVPFDVAKSRSPHPDHARLQPIIECIDCHSADGSVNFKSVSNDALKLFRKIDLLGDLGAKHRSRDDFLDRVLGAYTGDVESVFRGARDRYSQVVLKAVGRAKDADPTQRDVVKVMAQRQVDAFRRYNDVVTPREYLRRLGFDVPEADAERVLNNLLKPRQPPHAYAAELEDGRIAGAMAGINLTMEDWGLSHGIAASRAKWNLDALNRKNSKK